MQNLKNIYAWESETLKDPVELVYADGLKESYPLYKSLMSGIDTNKLLSEFEDIQHHLITTPEEYLQKWFDPRGINIKRAYVELNRVGFTKHFYQQFNIMDPQPGTSSVSEWNVFKDWVGPYTKSVINSFQGKVNRVRYSVVKPGWELKPHVDYPAPQQHGFRIHIPVRIDDTRHQMSLDGVNWEDVNFLLGHAWFMNVSYPHAAQHYGTKERIYITADLWSDRDFI